MAAGDSSVGDIAVGLCRNISVKEAFRLRISPSLITVTKEKEGTFIGSYNKINSMITMVDIFPYEIKKYK